MSLHSENKIIKLITQMMNPREEESFLKEIEQSKELTELYQTYVKTWDLTNQLNHSHDDSDTSWEQFNSRIKAPIKLLGLDWRKLAASITLLAAFSFGMWFFGSTNVNLATRDNVETYDLADNTSIKLNRNSSITYEKGDLKGVERTVCLTGEAYFDVAKSDKNFRVKTALGDIVVHGTQFSVMSSENLCYVELYEGSISYENEGNSIDLVPNERLILSHDRFIKEEFSKPVSWTEGISCNNVPLSYVLGQLQLTYGVSCDVAKKVQNEKYTINLPLDDIEMCIKILRNVSGQNFALIDNTIIVKD